MSRALVILKTQADRDKASRWCQGVPLGTTVEFRENKRTIPQNDAMWAALQDIAQQKDYHGFKLSKEEWKVIFLDALDREVKLVPSLDGTGIVSLGYSSSKLTTEEMTGLLSIIYEWGARNGVQFSGD